MSNRSHGNRPTAQTRTPLRRCGAVAVLAALATSWLATLIHAQTPPATAPATTRPNQNALHGVTTQPSGGMLLNFKDASIDTVLDELSAAAGFIVVKEVKPEGRVTLVSKQPVNSADAVSLLNTVLRNAGYAAIQQGRILKIVNRDAAKRLNIPVRSGADPDKIEATDELITQVVPIRFADAVQLRQDLQPLVNPAADFTANASSNALVITDTSANIRRIVQIVAALDTHLADAAEVKVFQLQYASAAGAARLINEVFGNQDQFAGPGGGQAQPAQQGQAGGRGQFGGGPGGFGGPGEFFAQRFRDIMSQQRSQQQGRQGVRVNASADDRTNTVVVVGPADTLKIVERVVKELDSNPAAEEAVFIYHLKNGQALNVEAVMNMLFNGTSTGSRSTASLQNARTGQSNVTNRSQRGTRSTGSGSSGALGTGGGGFGTSAAMGTRFGTGGFGTGFGGGGFAGGFGGAGAVSPSALSTASQLAGQVTIIADPDSNSLLVRTAPKNYERVRQVLAELDRPVAQVLIKVLIAEVTHGNSSDLGVEFSVLNLRAGGTAGQRAGTNFGLSKLSGGLVAQVLETDFTATLRALETLGKLDVLSRPYILASDNQLASITVGQEIPFITQSRTTDTGQTINTIQYDDIGILLDVVPHINPEGLVIMDVAPEISALTGTTVPVSDGVEAPVIAKRSAQSRVAVRNGQTVVIGGLMEDRKTQTINKVPLLGDIPIVGELFKRRQNSKTKTELLIFLTPHVAAQPQDLQGMSQDELEGSKLVPKAVDSGAFDEHRQGLDRGGAAATMPSTRPVRE